MSEVSIRPPDVNKEEELGGRGNQKHDRWGVSYGTKLLASEALLREC
jgi:hypothetical protein